MPKLENGVTYQHVRTGSVLRPMEDWEVEHYIFIQYKKLSKEKETELRGK